MVSGIIYIMSKIYLSKLIYDFLYFEVIIYYLKKYKKLFVSYN